MPLNRPDYLNDPGPGFVGQQLEGIFPGANNLLGLLNIKPDQDIWNALAGNPYAYQQSGFGGNNTMADIRLSQARTAFRQDLDAGADDRFRQMALEGYYRAMDFDSETARQRAQQQWSPAGLIGSFAMTAYEVPKAREQLTQGFLEMNLQPITPGIIDTNTMGNEYVSRQLRQRDAATQFSKTLEERYFRDPAAFGGLTYGETGEVFAQMTSRNTISMRDMTNADGSANEARIGATTDRVREMSRAVDAMQELFGGTIPEVFDKLDQVFGGSASAMGGQQLESRVRELKQLSAVSGQSLQATAQMVQVGQQYAQQAGFDAGIGTSAAMETTAQLGVSVDSSGFNMRRVNMGRVRAMALRSNVASATSPFAQYYAGAREIFIDKELAKLPEGTSVADRAARREELADQFFNRTQGVNSLAGLSEIVGESGSTIQRMSMSERALIAMQDDPRVAQAAARRTAAEESTVVGSGIMRALSQAGIEVTDADIFESVNGRTLVRGGSDIISRLQARTANQGRNFDIEGLVNRAGGTYAELVVGEGTNFSEFNVRQRQMAGAAELRRVADAQAQFETDMEAFSGAGGFMGIMNFLSDNALAGDNLTAEQQAAFDALPRAQQERIRRRQTTVGGFVNAFLGAVDPTSDNDATRQGQAANFVATATALFQDKDTDAATKERLGVIFNAIVDPQEMNKALSRLDEKGKTDVAKLIREGKFSPDTEEGVANAKKLSYLLGTEKFRTREDFKTRIDKFEGKDLTNFNLDDAESKREAIVTAALAGVNKTAFGKGESAQGIVDYLTKDDKSLKDIYERLDDESLGLSSATQKRIKEDIEKFDRALSTGQSPAKPDLAGVLERLVEVLRNLESKQPSGTGG